MHQQSKFWTTEDKFKMSVYVNSFPSFQSLYKSHVKNWTIKRKCLIKKYENILSLLTNFKLENKITDVNKMSGAGFESNKKN